jgi:glycerate-2-kinase
LRPPPEGAAGALADDTTLARAKAVKADAVNYLLDNDSYHYFQTLGDLFHTGPTGTNVMDIGIVLVE